MAEKKRALKTCAKGHKFYKSSDCPVCPICEVESKPKTGFLSTIGAPARRALEREGLITLEILAKTSEKDILRLHGIGPSAIPKLKAALKKEGLEFQKK